MTAVTRATKIKRVDAAFSKLMSEYLMEKRHLDAAEVFKALQQIDDESKVKLFDILTQA